LNLPVAFVGKKAGNPAEVGEEFKAWLGTRRVLFPVSTVSKESIVKVVDENQSEKVLVYETLPTSIQVEQLDLAIFTSPSNLESFLNAGNTIPSKTIAWGNTTLEAMHSRDIQATSTLETSTELELISVLNNLITQ
jgi:uroporphyrinogen-III synthase